MNVNETLAQQLHKPEIRKLQRREVYAKFEDNIWAADLAEMGSLSSFNRDIKYLFFVIDVFTKYSRVESLMHKNFSCITRNVLDTKYKYKSIRAF